MNSTNFNTIINRRGTESVKWNLFDPDVLPMWVADMDFPTPEPVIDALRKRIEHGIFGYPVIEEQARTALVNWLAERHAWDIEPDHVIFLPGVVTGFNLATHACTEPGQGILVQTPAYRPFLDVPANTRRHLQISELRQSNRQPYSIDRDEFTSSINDQTGIFMLCNPQNPTGRVFTKQELEFMAGVCLENDVVICSDEIHADLVYPPHQHIPIASLSPEIAGHTITLLAPSKTFNIAGLKASAAIISNPDLRERFCNARQGLVGWVNLLGMTALQAAYQYGADWLDELLLYLAENRDFLLDFTARHLPDLHVQKPEGTFLAWIDFRETGIENPQEFLIQNAKVGLNDGEWFGENGKGFVRLNFACPRSILVKGLERIRQALDHV